MPASIEARPFPDHPDCTAYQITGPSPGSVQRAIDHLFADAHILDGEFRHPRRVNPGCWQSRGYVRSAA